MSQKAGLYATIDTASEDEDEDEELKNNELETNEEKENNELETNKPENNENIIEDGATMEDILLSIDNIMIGMEKRERIMSDIEKKTVAYHEAGHALISYLLKDTYPPVKISIIPRGEAALGFTLQEPVDQKLYTKEHLLSKICVLLGGRVAEEITFNKITTGASDDIQKLSNMAYHMVTTYGMNDNIGPINLNDEENYGNKLSSKISNKKKQDVDVEIRNIVDKCLSITRTLLKKYKKQLEKIAEHLLKNEILIRDDFNTLFTGENIENSECVNS